MFGLILIILSVFIFILELLLTWLGVAQVGGTLTIFCGLALFIGITSHQTAKNNEEQQQKEAAKRVEARLEAARSRRGTAENSYDDVDVSFPAPHAYKNEYTYDSVKLATPTNADLSPDFNTLTPGTALTLVQEPANTYDNKAVAVFDGPHRIGFLFRGRLQGMANDFLNRGDTITATINTASSDGITINLLFNKQSRVPPQRYKLTGNKNADMQGEISATAPSEKVDVSFDPEKDTYTAFTDYAHLGWFPKSANNKLSYYATAVVDSIVPTENNPEKFDVFVLVTFGNPPW